MSQKEQSKFIGKRGYIVFPRPANIKFLVEVIDAGRSYGHDSFLVKPVDGIGEFWTRYEIQFI